MLNSLAPHSTPSVYGYVANQLEVLITRLGLQRMRSQIMQAYAEVCQGSLALPLGTRPSHYSRINYDGTPFQFAVTLGPGSRTLQFLSEAGLPGLSSAQRIQANRDCMTTLAAASEAKTALDTVVRLLETMAPPTNRDLLADSAGAFWIGMGFAAAARHPQLRIYINAQWGVEPERWARLRHFASYFGALESWLRLERRLAPDLKPLGTAIMLNGDQPPTGRLYLSTYGKRMSFYADLATWIADDNFARTVLQFAECLLGDDLAYPTQTCVCSFVVGTRPVLDFKLELCAHCLFASDAEAASRLGSWCSAARLDPTDYGDVLDVLSEGRLSRRVTDLHSYVGVGQKQGTTYATVYLKPRLIATDED